MAELRETYVQKTDSGGARSTPWLAFLVGALLIAVIAAFFLNSHLRVSGPGGTVDVKTSPPVTTTAPAPSPSAPAR
jgi:hypothetical protein